MDDLRLEAVEVVRGASGMRDQALHGKLLWRHIRQVNDGVVSQLPFPSLRAAILGPTFGMGDCIFSAGSGKSAMITCPPWPQGGSVAASSNALRLNLAVLAHTVGIEDEPAQALAGHERRARSSGMLMPLLGRTHRIL